MSLRSYLAVIAAFSCLLIGPALAIARVPQGFVGMNADQALFDAHVSLGPQLDRMVSSGVESIRVSLDWSAAQPYRSFADVPAGQASQFQDEQGVPTSFSAIDGVVGPAAARGLTILPVVLYAPTWDARHPGMSASPPSSATPYARFLTALIGRYGPHGSFWAQNPQIPRRPIRMWQVWNEPNLSDHWSDQPRGGSQSAYVHLLRAAHAAIKAADPGAKVVLAGLANYSWKYLASIYQVRGSRGLFDLVTIHPYTASAPGVIEILRLVRGVMDSAGDRRKPMLATEIGWPSSQGKTPSKQITFETTEVGQAKRLARVIPMLVRDRVSLGLQAFYYYTWIGAEPGQGLAFNYAGLFRYSSGRIVAKPVFAVFRHNALVLERCRRKGALATSCVKPSR